MRFLTTSLAGAVVIEPDRVEDERGFFARVYSQDEFAEQGLTSRIVQCNVSFNPHRGTLRGMHYQEPPHAEAKIVRCTRGAIHDVLIDLRRESPTFCRWEAVELTEDNRRSLYAAEGFAHGFLTLQDNTEVFYQISQAYTPAYARGVRWDDPAFGIRWPFPPRVISRRDQSYSDYLARRE